ncbi:MAG TPA: MBL fold metallo-hydrolase [Nevskiaceae bacterium]|nr:MBL fold metallo-hydrolase [Nevskiaceae bacterium]
MTARSHHYAGRFRNRYGGGAPGPSFGFIKFILKLAQVSRSGGALPLLKPEVESLRNNRSESTLTWIGHSTFLLQHAGINLITDPHLTQRASPFRHAGPARFTPPALEFSELPKLDIALVSHDHYDHLDEQTVTRLAREHPHLVFVVPRGLKAWFKRRHIHKVVELDLWQHSPRIGGVTVHCVPVQHFSGRGPHDRNATLWCGYVVEIDGRKIFFAGDTGYSRDFTDIHAKHGEMDLSLLPIGAYEPREFMAHVHVDPAEAVRIHQDLHSRQSVAMHWGVFRLTLEPLDEPPVKLAQALAAQGIAAEKFRVMQIGETLKDFL